MATATRQIGSYIVERELGRGGMGVVFLARHVVLGTHAVVKQLVPELTGDAGAVQRFITEAQAAAALKHRNIVQVIDCGQAADGQWYIVLEYLDGAPLATRIKQGPLDMYTALAILVQAANALHTAHGHGIVHRDVKPDNIFLTSTPSGVPLVTLLDFGIAKLHDNRAHLTRTGVGMGTPAYMPPEQLVAAKDVDARADVYALAVVAFETITGGHLPWQTTAPAAIYSLQIAQPPPDARQFFDRVPPAWALVIQHGMIAQRDDRLPSVRELILALAEATPADALCPGGGIQIVREHAPELLAMAPSDDTIGSRLERLDPVAAPIAAPIDLGLGRPTPPLAARIVTPSASAAPAVGWRPPASDAPRVTTLGSATGQSSPSVAHAGPAAPQRRRGLVISGGAVALAGATAAFVVGFGGSGGRSVPSTTGPVAAAADHAHLAQMSALAVVTEPAGATILVDGADRGTSPLNVPIRVGQIVTIEARLDGYTIAREIVTGATNPGTARLALTPVAAPRPVDAGTTFDAPPSVDAGRPRTGPHGRTPRIDAGTGAGSGSNFDPDAVGGGH